MGLSLATLLSQKHSVTAIDVIKEKVDLINMRKSPIIDKEIQEYLSHYDLDLHATVDYKESSDSDYVIIAAPTNYNSETNYFDTSILESAINSVIENNNNATIVIKSTIPIGYTKELCSRLDKNNILFSPEFLREGRALYDNLHPSRIVIGLPIDNPELKYKAQIFANILKECSLENDVPHLIIGSTEAESIKLFSNTYLAMRVAYFNELDSFAETYDLNSRDIITGVCLDPRVGNYYNNPSLGYGGYCLPKDTKQLLSNYINVPNSLINAIVDSNKIRKEYIITKLINKIHNDSLKTIGIYRLTMKSGSDNYRDSSITDIMLALASKNINILIYEPTYEGNEFKGCIVEHNFEKFKNESDIIIANRYSEELENVKNKLYCRDLFMRD